eukprot:tig00000093_g3560.t1
MAEGAQAQARPQTYVVYDRAMLAQAEVSSDCENKRRYSSLLNQLQASGLVNVVERLPSRLATREEILLVHEEQYVDEVWGFSEYLNKHKHAILAAPNATRDDRDKKRALIQTHEEDKRVKLGKMRRDNYTPFAEGTTESARYAAGCTIQAVEQVVRSVAPANGVAFVRPPGHHAKADSAGGFCIFNNVAIAAAYARRELGVRRVLIVDWDVHAADGTAELVAQDEGIMLISVHRYDYTGFYPGGADTYYNGVHGAAKGRVVHIPLCQHSQDSSPEVQEAEFKRAAEETERKKQAVLAARAAAEAEAARLVAEAKGGAPGEAAAEGGGAPPQEAIGAKRKTPPPPSVEVKQEPGAAAAAGAGDGPARRPPTAPATSPRAPAPRTPRRPRTPRLSAGRDRVPANDAMETSSSGSDGETEAAKRPPPKYILPFGDDCYEMVFDELVLPMARKFAPELVVVSGGFDAASGDPLGGLLVSPAGFAAMTRRLMTLADGRVVIVTEGGYEPYVFASCAIACLRELVGAPNPALAETRRMIGLLRDYHSELLE